MPFKKIDCFFKKLGTEYENINLQNELDDLIKKTLFVKKKKRYLSKNNYNIFRLKYLIKQYSDANFIILFRDPIETIISLGKVHEKFMDLGKNDKNFLAINPPCFATSENKGG